MTPDPDPRTAPDDDDAINEGVSAPTPEGDDDAPGGTDGSPAHE